MEEFGVSVSQTLTLFIQVLMTLTESVALSKRIDLSQNTSLRKIFFNKIRLYADPPRSRSCGWIISIISSIAHPSLEAVTFTILLGHVDEIDALELSALDTLFLNQPLSNNSTKLRFIICASGSADREVVEAALKDGLPKLDENKRLEFGIGYNVYVVFIL